MKVYKRMALKDWCITAQNGDHFELRKGETYTTSALRESDGKITVFANYWVPVPADALSEGVLIE